MNVKLINLTNGLVLKNVNNTLKQGQILKPDVA